MIPKRKPLQEDSVDSWLMSYADMITLLMCFFIIFVSVSEPKKDKFSKLTEGLANKFGSVDLSTPFQGVFQELQLVVESNQVFRDVAIEKTDKGVEMELASDSFFYKNSAELDPKKINLLQNLSEALQSVVYVDYVIIVEGHTNNIPTTSEQFATNWELSAARASRMVRFLIEQGVQPNRLRAIGLADSDPKVPNLDAAGKPIEVNQAQNDRMVFKLERRVP